MIIDKIFEKISFKTIWQLLLIINNSSLKDISHIKDIYENKGLYFDEHFLMLKLLNICKVNDNKVILKNIKIDEESLKLYMINQLFLKKKTFKLFWLFISNFTIQPGYFVYSPFVTERLKYSGLRDFLMELNFLKKLEKDVYVITPKYMTLVLTKRIFGPEELDKKLVQQKELGTKAERMIYNYELNQLNNFTELKEKEVIIEYVAKRNVNAGYDIISFDKIAAKNGDYKKIYIEVKAVSDINYHFYWSKNEIEIAKLLLHNYYLYLLPTNGDVNLKKLRIIMNPYKNIFDSQNWLKQEEILSIKMKGHEDGT